MADIPAQALEHVREAQLRTGAGDLAAALVLAVAGPESSYRPGAVGDDGTSFGYTQLHVGGGLGDGHPVEELLDPVANLAIAMRYIQDRLDAGASPYQAIGPWSTRDIAIGRLGDAEAALGGIPRGITADGPTDSGGGLVLLTVAALVLLALVD